MKVVRNDEQINEKWTTKSVGSLQRTRDEKRKIYRDIDVCKDCEHFQRKMMTKGRWDDKECEYYACEADRIKIGWMNKVTYEHEYADTVTCPLIGDLKFVTWNDDDEKDMSFQSMREEQLRNIHEEVLKDKWNEICKEQIRNKK